MWKQNETLLKKCKYPMMPVEMPIHVGKRNKNTWPSILVNV